MMRLEREPNRHRMRMREMFLFALSGLRGIWSPTQLLLLPSIMPCERLFLQAVCTRRTWRERIGLSEESGQTKVRSSFFNSIGLFTRSHWILGALCSNLVPSWRGFWLKTFDCSL